MLLQCDEAGLPVEEIVSLRYYFARVRTIDTKPVALVTGASSGIGRAAAVALAAAGFDVAVNYSSSEKSARETVRLAEEKGAKTLLIKCDVSDDPGVKAMLASVESTFGRLDALVNNAGITSDVGPKDLDAMTPEEWDRVFAVNVRGMFQVTRSAVPMLRAAHGSIVNTASIVGLRPGLQPLPYAASKAAVVSLTKLFAINLGPEIRVNAVAPGWMEGDWMQRTLGDRYEDLMARRAKATPLKRVIDADDVAEVIVNLIVSNKMVNGEIVVVDGGFASST
jgi:3-oxoacyl-[acyl-carrier protein] reductase